MSGRSYRSAFPVDVQASCKLFVSLIVSQGIRKNMANRGVKCWDPSNSQDWDKMDVSAICTKRMMRDIEAILQEEKSGSLGIFIYPNSENICKLRALIVGPPDTPYDGGFFEFYLRVPPGYPIAAPRVRLLTTGDSTVRFGPNLYATGMVCLSILG